MITSAKLTAGYGAKLPNLKGRTFEFTPGLNVLFGPNGSGKSTLAKVIAAYSSCQKEGGWSRPVGVREEAFPDAFSNECPGMGDSQCRADVKWDGTVTFFTASEESDAPVIAFGMPSDGLMDEMERIFMRRDASSGQNRIRRLEKMLATMKAPPDLLKDKFKVSRIDGSIGFVTAKDYPEFARYIKRLKPGGRATLVADEIDRSLDLVLQAALFTRILPKLATTTQIIIASHSPFVFASKDANIIEMEEGGAKEGRGLLEVATNHARLDLRVALAFAERMQRAKK